MRRPRRWCSRRPRRSSVPTENPRCRRRQFRRPPHPQNRLRRRPPQLHRPGPRRHRRRPRRPHPRPVRRHLRLRHHRRRHDPHRPRLPPHRRRGPRLLLQHLRRRLGARRRRLLRRVLHHHRHRARRSSRRHQIRLRRGLNGWKRVLRGLSRLAASSFSRSASPVAQRRRNLQRPQLLCPRPPLHRRSGNNFRGVSRVEQRHRNLRLQQQRRPPGPSNCLR